MTANGEGMADLTPLLAGDAKNAAYAWAPVVSPVSQKARLVIDTQAEVTAWLDGKPVLLPRATRWKRAVHGGSRICPREKPLS